VIVRVFLADLERDLDAVVSVRISTTPSTNLDKRIEGGGGPHIEEVLGKESDLVDADFYAGTRGQQVVAAAIHISLTAVASLSQGPPLLGSAHPLDSNTKPLGVSLSRRQFIPLAGLPYVASNTARVGQLHSSEHPDQPWQVTGERRGGAWGGGGWGMMCCGGAVLGLACGILT
jgi:hypothetical protein